MPGAQNAHFTDRDCGFLARIWTDLCKSIGRHSVAARLDKDACCLTTGGHGVPPLQLRFRDYSLRSLLVNKKHRVRHLSGGQNRTRKFVNCNQTIGRVPAIIKSCLPFAVTLKRYHDDKV